MGRNTFQLQTFADMDVSSPGHTEMLWVRRCMRSVLFAMQGFRFPGLQLQAFLPVLPQDAPVTSTSDAD